MHRTFLRYVVLLVVFGGATAAVLVYGARLKPDPTVAEKPGRASAALPGTAPQAKPAAHGAAAGGSVFLENLRNPLSILLLQAIVILLAAKLVGMLVRKAGQPQVIGEMIAGILLGPSLLGLIWPESMTFLFPPQSMGALGLLSQVGVVVFMFVVGMGVDLGHLREKAHEAVLVSHASIVAPFFMGAAFSLLIYRSYAPSDIGFTAFALFMSVAMSITAFPVLARILDERGLTHTHLGNTAIACAAVDDVTAWCILAIVIAIVGAAGLASAALTIFLTVVFIAFMLFVIKPRAARMVTGDLEGDARGRGPTAVVLMFVFASALLTEVIGIHALFGAFLAGVVMPQHGGLRKVLTERLGGFASSFLLPLFFAFTGLRTQIGLLNDWSSALVCVGVIAVAVAGKLGGTMLAAHWAGMSRHDSLSLGILMNTRGMVELIVLNIGYDLGILGPRIFSMMVIMAITTTFMTGPLLSLPGYRQRKRGAALNRGADVVA
jgi:Kef-type K+ transport system membrane component KefB